jgi:hypothetical protein
MSEVLALRIERERMRATSDVIRAWMEERREGGSASEAELLVAMAIEHVETVRRLWNTTAKAVTDGNTDDPDQTWCSLMERFDESIDLMQRIRAIAGAMAKRGGPVEGAAELEEAIKEVEAMRQAAYEAWPQEDPAQLAAAQEYARRVLPNEKLLELAKSHPAPQAWYDEEGLPAPKPAEEE